MKKLNLWLLGSLFMGALTVVSCGDDDENGGSNNGGGNGGNQSTVKVDYTKTGGNASVSVTDGPSYAMDFAAFSKDELGGVSIIDGVLTFNNYISGEVDGKYTYQSCQITVEGYSEGKTTYNDVDFYFGNNDFSCQQVNVETKTRAAAPGTNKLTVTKRTDGNYEFKLEGSGVLYGGDIQPATTYEANATVQLNMVVPIGMTATPLTNVRSKASSFPSFTPWLNGQVAQTGMQFSNSPQLGRGVLLWFYDQSLGYADYLNLKEQATKALGQPIVCHDGGADAETVQDVAASYFFKDGKYIMVSFCPWRQEEGPDYFGPVGMESVHENHAGRIHIHAIEGMTIDPYAIIWDLWGGRE